MIDGLLEFAAARRADPGDDLTSFLVQFEFDGKRLDDKQLIDILWNLIGGGVDTTTSLTALSLLHLGTHPDLRRQLIDRPALYRTAADEFLRYFSVNKQLSRTVSRDTVLAGQQLRRNDRVLISWIAANHDEQQFECPRDVLLDRSPNRHVAFGLGPHRCIGAPLARVMFEVMVKAVLDRIPDYVVDLDGVSAVRGQPHDDGGRQAAGDIHAGAVVGDATRWVSWLRTARTARRRRVWSVNSSMSVPPITPSRWSMNSVSETSGTPSSLAW